MINLYISLNFIILWLLKFIFFNNYSCLHFLKQFLQESHNFFIDFQNLSFCQLIYNVFELSTIKFDIIVFSMLLILESIQKNLWIKLLIKILFFKNYTKLIFQICSIFLYKIFLCSYTTAFFMLTIIQKHFNQVFIFHFMILFQSMKLMQKFCDICFIKI